MCAVFHTLARCVSGMRVGVVKHSQIYEIFCEVKKKAVYFLLKRAYFLDLTNFMCHFSAFLIVFV